MKRFFSNDSFWNTPIGADPEIQPGSEELMRLLANEPSSAFFGINLHRWTIPVYEVDSSTPRCRVHQRVIDVEKPDAPLGYWGKAGKHLTQFPGFGESVPIPLAATPDNEADAHMGIVDWEAKLAWDMWGAQKRSDGQWESYTGMCYRIDGPGVFDRKNFSAHDGDSIHFHGPSRAAGVPAIAGLIMHEEVETGRIEHKLAFATRFNARKRFTFPATWTDGQEAFGLPEGAVLQLNPALDLDGFDLSPGAKVVAEALQEYGMVDVDVGGDNTLYGEGLWSHPDKSWEELLDPFALQGIALCHYRVLKFGEIINAGN